MTVRLPLLLSACFLIALAHPTSVRSQSRLDNSIAITGGLYAASGIGTNFFSCGRYDYSFFGGRSFVEASVGVGSIQSNVISAISKAAVFASNNLVMYEFSFAYDATPAGAFPFLLFGVANVKEGEESHFAPVIGLGKRIPVPGLLGSNALGIRYDIRDQIFSQRVNNSDAFVAHNLVVTIGLQVYF
jgi:hypothetical protein